MLFQLAAIFFSGGILARHSKWLVLLELVGGLLDLVPVEKERDREKLVTKKRKRKWEEMNEMVNVNKRGWDCIDKWKG